MLQLEVSAQREPFPPPNDPAVQTRSARAEAAANRAAQSAAGKARSRADLHFQRLSRLKTLKLKKKNEKGKQSEIARGIRRRSMRQTLRDLKSSTKTLTLFRLELQLLTRPRLLLRRCMMKQRGAERLPSSANSLRLKQSSNQKLWLRLRMFASSTRKCEISWPVSRSLWAVIPHCSSCGGHACTKGCP